MKRLLASFALIAAAAALSGCYYDPGYSYVRTSGYGGDAYYGQGGSSYYVAPSYYGGYYGNGYYGGGYYGCCYSPGVSIGISSGWYGSPRYRHGGYRGHGAYPGGHRPGQGGPPSRGHGGSRGGNHGGGHDHHR